MAEGMSGAPRSLESVAGVPTDPDRWNSHVRAEATVTTALRHLQDNEVVEALSALVRAAELIFSVIRMDMNEQKEV